MWKLVIADCRAKTHEFPSIPSNPGISKSSTQFQYVSIILHPHHLYLNCFPICKCPSTIPWSSPLLLPWLLPLLPLLPFQPWDPSTTLAVWVHRSLPSLEAAMSDGHSYNIGNFPVVDRFGDSKQFSSNGMTRT